MSSYTGKCWGWCQTQVSAEDGEVNKAFALHTTLLFLLALL